jgi:hypothetical protein
MRQARHDQQLCRYHDPTLGKLPSTLATSSLDASRRLTACTSSLPLERDRSSSRK